MKILNVQVLKGPNYWSNYRKKLIVVTLDLEEYEELPSNKLPGFNKRLKNLIPSLYEHRCSIGMPGGFFQRLEDGTWLGHIIEHIALELQTLAGMKCGFGRTYGTHQVGVYEVIFAYETEEAGLYAAEAAVKIAQTLALEKSYIHLQHDLNQLRELHAEYKYGPSTEALIQEAERRKIPVISIADSSLVLLGYGCKQKKIWASVTSQTNSIGVDVVANKELTKQILRNSFIPVPQGILADSLTNLEQGITKLGFPLVIKPASGNHGRGIITNINSLEKAIEGFKVVQNISKQIIIERFISGDDYRFLVVNYRVVAVAKRTPAHIVGTGKDTIQQLIEKVNQDPKRGKSHENVLTSIKIDETTETILKDNHFTLDSVLSKGEILYLKDAANLSSGGTATDVTEEVHPHNILLAERIARLVNLDVCGIDIIATDITSPLNQDNGAVLEVNAGPGLRMHLHPNEGEPRNVAAPILDMLYPQGSSATIPLVAVTGTNGKTTVVRLIAYLAKKAKYHVGYTSTEGIYLDDQLIYSGDCSGPLSAKAVLSEPLVDFAVLECARGGILRAGLAFDECDISVVTNVSNDHLGLDSIMSIEEMADVKAVVPLSTKKEGHAILNAEDDLVFDMKTKLSCNIALFGLQENFRIIEHCNQGGLAAYIENNFIVVHQDYNKYYLTQISNLPITFNGTATCMIKNVLPAILAAVISKFPLKLITEALIEFQPTAENLPGRMNVFNFEQYQVMLDYAHNEGAFLEVEKYLQTIDTKRKVAIIGATGDRQAGDIQKLGFYAGKIFDEIVIRHDKDGRGKTNSQLTELLMQGISQANTHPKVEVISNEFEAVKHVISQATPGTFIFYTADNIFDAINFMKQEEQSLVAIPGNLCHPVKRTGDFLHVGQD